MKHETNIIECIKEYKKFALIRETTQHAVYNDEDTQITGWDVDKEEVYMVSFDTHDEMESFICDLSVTCGESEGTKDFRILFCNPKRFWEEADLERKWKAEELLDETPSDPAEDEIRKQEHKSNEYEHKEEE